jgi:hypothetical protein
MNRRGEIFLTTAALVLAITFIGLYLIRTAHDPAPKPPVATDEKH